MKNDRWIIAEEAEKMVGLKEQTANQAPWLQKIWDATWYQEGQKYREPYCAAAVCYWLQEADKRSDLIHFNEDPVMPKCSDLLEFLSKDSIGATIFKYQGEGNLRPERGDIVFFMPRVSHVGVVVSEAPYLSNDQLFIDTVEANTDDRGSREGEGVYKKKRSISFCGDFVRIPLLGKRIKNYE